MNNANIEKKISSERIKQGFSMLMILFATLMLAILVPNFFVVMFKANEFAPALMANIFFLVLDAYFIYLYKKSNRRRKELEKDKLTIVFFSCLNAHDNQLTSLDFAKYANLDGEQARTFLEEKISEFSGNLEITENGGIIYHFESASNLEK